MNAAIYVRVSTDQQAEKGYSIDTQLEACRQYAHEFGATTVEEFIDDGYSGEFIDRPALTRLREKLAQQAFDVVIAYAPDRLARKTIHLLIISEEIAKAGALRKFASVNFEATSEGELMYKFQGIVAEYEKEKIKERTMRGKRGKAAKGFVISNAKPFGYTFDADHSTYIINEPEAKIVRMIFDFLIQEKMGTGRICKELNSRGIPSPRLKKFWIVSSVHRILTNTIYKGIIYSMKYRYEKIGLKKKKRSLRPKSEWLKLHVPAIIDEVTWEAAQKQLHDNKSFARRNLKRNYLLNGMVTCGVCGKAMVISRSGGKNPRTYYACLSQRSSAYLHSGQKPCTARQIPTQLLDEHVFRFLIRRFCTPDTIASQLTAIVRQKDSQKYQTALYQMLNTEQELHKQQETVLRWFRQKMLTESETERQLQDIKKALTDIGHLKKIYENELTAVTSGYSTDEMFAAVTQHFHQLNFTINEEKAALRAIIDKVIATRIDKTRGRGSHPEINVQLRLK